eukprot:PLAT3669.6.p1 GENE.PLAT3669.6~~PLAT3669.6.p1  ORF type:complete len:1024 (+),score=377.90 PLAT3669.6:128-3073(+)
MAASERLAGLATALGFKSDEPDDEEEEDSDGGGDGPVASDEEEEDEEEDVVRERLITIGLCAMEKKVRSKPMQAILQRFRQFGMFEVIYFGDELLLEGDIEDWPAVDVLFGFYSRGFPLEKAIRYAELRKPLCVNDLKAQRALLDRRMVYSMLEEAGIPVRRYGVVNRLPGEARTPFEEHEDYIVIDGLRIDKPFVEKPVNAEDHNVYVYYPRSAGGGSKRLFRKVKNRSSRYYPDCNNVRRDGSFLYEEFVNTEGADVKVYTVGPTYAHAEARKSPVVDGIVERRADGKERRYPVMLRRHEKDIAKIIVEKFKQVVCGFDLLRGADGAVSVCDVNGWSFVKGNEYYYDDCSKILKEFILRNLFPGRKHRNPRTRVNALVRQRSAAAGGGSTGSGSDSPVIVYPSPLSPSASPVKRSSGGSGGGWAGSSAGGGRSRSSSASSGTGGSGSDDDDGASGEYGGARPGEELRCVLAVMRHGDRRPKEKMKMKVRCKPLLDLFRRRGRSTRAEVKLKSSVELQNLLDIVRNLVRGEDAASVDAEELEGLTHVLSVLERGGRFEGVNRKVQLKPSKWEQRADGEHVTVAKLVLKWGGELTHTGVKQAANVGRWLRARYGKDDKLVLQLHQTYRHDLKFYASDEGRVLKSAASCAKALLCLQGELTPIVYSLLRTGPSTHTLLDDTSRAGVQMERAKDAIDTLLNSDGSTALPTARLAAAFKELGSPRERLAEVHAMISSIVEQLREKDADELLEDGMDTIGMVLDRWVKLEDELLDTKKGVYRASKVSDIYDCVRYDMLHNRSLALAGLDELYASTRKLALIVIPAEYGTVPAMRAEIGAHICSRLVHKLMHDLAGVAKPKHSGRVRSRLYFTSESHLHGMFNLLRFHAGVDGIVSDAGKRWMDSVEELSYMTHVLFMMYENAAIKGPHRYRIDILFSTGTCPGSPSPGDGHYVHISPRYVLASDLTLEQTLNFFAAQLDRYGERY